MLAEHSFLEFLKHVKVRSDDPLNPVITDWQPWGYLTEQAEAWESGLSEIILKDRQLGYSWLVAAFAVWKARRGAAVALVSKGQLESRELLQKCSFIERNLPPLMKRHPQVRADDMKYSGGVLQAFPSTPDAGVSFTFQLVVFDEAHFHPYAALNYAALRPTISAGGQFIALSTADPSMNGHGWFRDIYYASKRGETGYGSRFVPWNRRPGRDQAWYEREKAAYEGLPEEFDAYYADTDAQAFSGRTGLVFPMFNPEIHIQKAKTPIEGCRRVVAGVDLGGGDPTAIIVAGLDSARRVHVYAEYYSRGAQVLDDLAAFLVLYPVDRVVCPPEQATVYETLRKTYKIPAYAANNNRRDGLQLFAAQLQHANITIEPSCTNLINEFAGYRWAERVDPADKTKYQTKTPVDNHADAMDATRYMLMELLTFLHAPGAALPTRAWNSNRPLARKAS